METQARLRPLAAQAMEHWKEFQPKRYKAQKAAGTLNQTALEAAEKTLNEQAELIEGGIPAEIAWEMVREKYVLSTGRGRSKRGSTGQFGLFAESGTESDT